MGIFDHFKKKPEPVAEINHVSVFDTDYPIEKSNWQAVFSACLGPSMTIQQACADSVANTKKWGSDPKTVEIFFGKNRYPMEFIGVKYTELNEWQWCWSIENMPSDIIKISNEVRSIGESWGLEALTTSIFEQSNMPDADSIAHVACTLSKTKCFYYKVPHHNGYFVVAVLDIPESVFAPVGLPRFISITMDCIQQFNVDHKIFLESYLIWNGTKYDWDGKILIAHFEDDLHITFDTTNDIFRISSIQTAEKN